MPEPICCTVKYENEQIIEMKQMKKSRIIVATLAFGELPYFPFAREINEKYCRAHGYSFEVIASCEDDNRSSIWGKVSGVRTLLATADFVLFLDADAYFFNQEKSIESLISEHMLDASFVIGTDRRDQEFAWSDFNANTGVFIVKNDNLGQRILDSWWSAPMHFDRRWLWKWPVEQGAFNYIVRQLFDQRNINVIPYHYINGRDGSFIRHLVGMSNVERVTMLKKEVDRLG